MLLVATALVAGGGRRGPGDFVVHLAALPCLVVLVADRVATGIRMPRRWGFWWLAALALVALQLLPLPFDLFTALPGREALRADLALAGLEPASLPMTLDRWGTLRAGLALAVTGIAFRAAWRLDTAARLRVLALLLALGVAMAFLGYAQAAAGMRSGMRLYDFHHPIGAIGTFANRNHFASLGAVLAPLAIALAWPGAGAQRGAFRLMAGLAALAVVLASALSYSRAGFALTLLTSTLAIVALAAQGRRMARGPAAAALGLAGVAVLAVVGYAWDGLSRRLAQDPLDDLRWQFLEYAPRALAAYWPWGSGLGSFRWVYAAVEPVGVMQSVYAGHAHNDLLQIAIEAGLPGLVLLLAFAALVAADGLGNFRLGAPGTQADHALRRVMGIAVIAPLLHSLVDYPLRTLAVAVVLGVLLGWQATAATPRGPGSSSPE